ncbi:hypothetical protein C0Q58_14365 [Streptomyces albidoflavus]|uniref:hypothetical protein n=1 Tax=Streptomyces albidoflavus TaxID=1886 RepID=UPI00101E7F10|nr:hypothetical protein [Streptomyces albidoflavus]RZD62921.1 hypothetical protein C0Q58_14365 [Streptomyces albidoflavus]
MTTTTLGHLYAAAADRLRLAVLDAPHVPVGDRRDVALAARDLLRQVRDIVAWPEPDLFRAGIAPPAQRHFLEGLGQAVSELGAAGRMFGPAAADRPRHPHADALLDARRLVTAAGDVLASHWGEGLVPLTPYAELLGKSGARDHLVRQGADVAWQVSRLTHALTEGVGQPDLLDALVLARGSLERATILGRRSSSAAESDLSALPAALPAHQPDIALGPVSDLLQADADRLARAAHATLHGQDHEHRLTGTDLAAVARWTSMSRMLAGRLLLHLAEGAPPPVRDACQEAAGAHREAAMAWHATSGAWRHLVDTGAPQDQPRRRIVYMGQAVELPSTSPHPAQVTSRATVLRLGDLLYGPQWTPERSGLPPRPAGEILSFAAPGDLLPALYQLPASGWLMATAAPAAVARARARIVSDSADHRPAGLPEHIRYHPMPRRQEEELAALYTTVASAEQDGAAAVLALAEAAGAAVPRAGLDRLAQRQVVTQVQEWGQGSYPSPPPTLSISVISARAARARSTGDSQPRRPGPPRVAGRSFTPPSRTPGPERRGRGK